MIKEVYVISHDIKCSLCSKMISLDEHQFGLVFEDEHFVCEECTSKHTDEELKDICKTIMKDPDSKMPIALWLIHEQNKDKAMMTVKNE